MNSENWNSEFALRREPAGTPPPTTIHPLAPFGVQLIAHEALSVIDLDVDWLRALLTRHKVVVLRGFEALDKTYFMIAARRLGDLLEGDTGYVLEVAAREQERDGLLSTAATPFHWDRMCGRPVPGVIFYQCLHAPKAGQGGETMFCDTSAVIARARSAELVAWMVTEIACRPGAKAPREAGKRRPLIDLHPVMGESVIRFDEPENWAVTESERPLVEIYQYGQRLSPTESSRFLDGFIPSLYQERAVYVHRWREGDFVLADNHALLHARSAFDREAGRRLQRIHIV